MITYTCSYCQTEYTPKCNKPKGEINYCSLSCINKAQPRKKLTQRCKQCSVLMPKGRIYCSDLCREEAIKIKELAKIDIPKKPKVLSEFAMNNHTQRVIKRARDLKLKAVEYKGGSCLCCGYNKCVAALDFHHLDPTVKEMRVSKMKRSWENVKVELDKCILVCSNCHREIHAGMIVLTPLAGIAPT